MSPSHRNVRKAAILLASLNQEHVDALLRQMSPAQAHVLRQAVESLGEFNAWEQDDVIEEFFRVGPLLPEADAAGIELDAPLPATLSLGSASSGSPLAVAIEAGRGKASGVPFRFLHEAPPRRLAPFLEREHPQTIALVVSHLPADRAAEILAHLPGNLQIEVARRLVDLEETDPDVLREVERGLEAWLCSQTQGERRTASGVSALANILNAANPQARQHILANLARHDRQLAERLDGPSAAPLSFGDLECLDSACLAVVLHHADNEVLVLALAGAKPQFADRAIELLGTEAFAVSQALRNLGPTRMSDVEEAQRQLAEIACQLEQRGEIVPDVRGRLSLAV
jgi:flagellar motor switch protein FliG